jgi:hypothetical protein
VVWIAVSQKNVLLASTGGFFKMEITCLFGTVSIPDYFSDLWIENEVIKWRGGQGLVWRSSFVSMIYHTTLYRNSCSF